MAKYRKSKKRGSKQQNGGVQNTNIDLLPISVEQKEILSMIARDYLTPKQVSLKRKTSLRAVYKTLEKLKRKGLLKHPSYNNLIYNSIALGGGGSKFEFLSSIKQSKFTQEHPIRLHRQEFNFKIKAVSEKYLKIRQNKGIIQVFGHKVRLYKKSLEIYCKPSKSFLGKTPQQAWKTSQEYWALIFGKIERFLNILLWDSFDEVNAHYSELKNEIAVDMNQKNQKLHIRGSNDWRTWLIIDKSLSVDEMETIHPELSKTDMEKLTKVFNDYRDNEILVPSQMQRIMAQFGERIEKLESGLKTGNPSQKQDYFG